MMSDALQNIRPRDEDQIWNTRTKLDITEPESV